MAEVQTAEAKKGEDVTALTEMIEEFIKGKDNVDLPQDYLFSPAAAAAVATAAAAVDQADSPRETLSKSDSEATVIVANKHAWVSPNKNDEVPSSLERTFAGVASAAVLHASNKSFANIIHGEKHVMLVLPSWVSTSRWTLPLQPS